MPIQVIPQQVIAYPLDVHDLTLAATPPPALWAGYGFFVLQSDRTVKSGATVDAIRGGNQLRSGSGSVEWTLDSRWMPGASESVGFLMGVNATGTSTGNILEIRFSSTQYKIYNDSGLIAGTTTTYTAVAGDRIKLEVFGSTIRVYLNDVLKYTQTYTSTNPYPARYIAYTHAALAASGGGNFLEPPVLSGDWNTTEEFLEWHVPPTLGTYTLNTKRYVATVTVTGNPGRYNVTGVVGAYSTFTANATTNQITTTNSDVYAVDDRVRVGVLPGGTLPAPLDFETVYYVKTSTGVGGVLTLSLTQGGATLDITSAGTGGWIARENDVLLQYANAEVIVPPFDVIGLPGDNIVEMKPSAVRKFATTYDGAQNAAATNYITRSATGGTFDAAGNYTASATAGDYTLTFNSNNQRRVFTVRVPLTLTPENVRAAAPSEQILFTTSMGGSLTWSATGGSLSGSGSSRTWTAPTVIGQVVRIQVTNGTDTLYQDITILEALPVSYSVVNAPFEVGPTVLIEYADDDRTVWSRTLSEEDFIPQSWDLQSNGLTPTETQTLIDFNDEYLRSAGRFFFTDYVMNSVREIVRFDSRIKGEAAGDCLFNCAYRVRRA